MTMKTIRILNILLLIGIVLNSCQTSITKDVELKSIQESIKTFNNYYKIGDTASSSSDFLWNNENYVDTIYLKKFNLIDTTFNTIYKPKLIAYNCTLIGQYKYQNILLLLTSSARTQAGDGNPVLTLTTLSETGELIDYLRVDIACIQDPEIQPKTYFSINSDFSIYINQVQIENKIDTVKNQLIRIDSTSNITKYIIDKNGHFIKRNDIKEK